MITEQNIIEMVGDNVTATENMQFKILVKGKDQITPREHKAQQYDLTKKVLDGEAMEDDLGGTNSAKLIMQPPKQPYQLSTINPDESPDVIRIEVMSDNDYFFQYVFE